jgi:Zn-dependent protease with chaperone function
VKSNLGISEFLIVQLLKAKSFQSESLDELAEAMQVIKILKKSKLDRYYRAKFLLQGGMAFADRIFFDSKYLDTLLPDEMLAVGAHEFTHLNQRHGIKKFLRLILPPLIIGGVVGLIVISNFALVDYIPFVKNLGKTESTLLTGLLSFFVAYLAGLYVNAKWCRQQETNCDLSSVKFLNSEAMGSALIKLNNLRLRKMTLLDRLLPRLYPTLEQRINDIHSAVDNKKRRE